MYFNFRFLVPYNNSGVGYCPATILDLYFKTLNKDHGAKVTKGPLFYQGYGKPGHTDKTYFLKTPIGRVTLSDTGKEVARFLELEDPDAYTGHCFR